MARGGQLTARTVVFSADGKQLLVPTASVTRVYNCLTTDRVGEIRGHASDVTGVALSSAAGCKVLTCSTDGSIKLWSFPDCELLGSFTVGYPIEHLVVLPEEDVALCSLHWREGQAGRVVRVSLNSGKILPGEVLKTVQPGVPLVPSPSRAFIATFEKRVVSVWRSDSQQMKPCTFHHTKEFQCVCIDPEDKILAAGDVSGRILLWHNFSIHVDAKAAGQELEAPQCTTMHWHSQPVGCLTFTPDSTYLLSGGKEGVLVVWHLLTGQRNYLPRLGAGLRSIVACPTTPSLFCISQEDNTIRLFTLSSMQIIRSIHGVRPPPRGVNALELNNCTRLHPTASHVVMAGANSSLQFYDPLQDRHVSKLQVVARNSVLTDWQSKSVPLLEPRVSHLCFSEDGKVMVTIDIRPDPSGRSDALEAMRFWDEVNASIHTHQVAPYSLNTHVDQPHSEGTSTMCYHPLEDTVVTAGRQNGFRVWRRPAAAAAARSRADQRQKIWKCSCVGTYRRLPFYCSAFSSDGTILALGSASCVVLWEHPNITWVGALTCPGVVHPKSFFYSVALPGNSVFVVGATQGCERPQVVVWNVETLLPVWALSIYTCALCSHPSTPAFAVAVPARQQPGQGTSMPTSMVLLFEATSSRPKSVVRVPDCLFPWLAFATKQGLERRLEQDGGGAFHTSGSVVSSGPLLVLSERRAIYWAVPKGEHIPTLSTITTTTTTTTHASSAPASKLRSLFGDLHMEAAQQDGVMHVLPVNTEPELDRVAKLLDVPSHLLPPASTLCDRVLEMLLVPQTEE